ncbi:hypothetical protein RUM43_006613 [Polyplax serrata]|uniref:Uncharacterized protein n=1 Tax=Polyplax serrata TaxID=468196 RepID=A0AAN8NY08_POLSC
MSLIEATYLKPMHGITEMGRVQVSGGLKTAIYSYRNTMYLITAEHDAKEYPDSFQGSTLFRLMEDRGRIVMEKIQILNVVEPNDIQFWEHQDQFYMAVGTNIGNDTRRTGTLVYRWMGQHFDCIQQIPSKNVKSVAPFTMGSFMYLAVANYQDEYGNTDITSDIYQFNLDDQKFQMFQRIKTHGAQHFAYFQFQDDNLRKAEHFLAVANYMGKNRNGALTSHLDSIIYKFDGDRFMPFQSFKLLGAVQWLPVQGPRGEFLLLVAHSNGVRGYQYDGWRFTQVSLKFGQSPLAGNIQSMRSFEYFGDTFLTVADKNSFGEDVNLWKLVFTNKNEVEERYHEVGNWCENMKQILKTDNVSTVLDELKRISERLPEERKLKAEDLKLEETEQELRREVGNLMEQMKELGRDLSNVEEEMEKRQTDSGIPIFLGSKVIPRVEIKCTTRNCVTFTDLTVTDVNGENFPQFMKNVLTINDDTNTIEQELNFDRVVVQGDTVASSINGHPVDTLVDTQSETFINSQLVVNGTVLVNNDLNVYGLFGGVTPNDSNILLYDGNQIIDGKLTVKNLKVGNLKLSGIFNRHPLDELLQHPKVELKNNYKELNVNNMVVDGLVDGHNISELWNTMGQIHENLEFEGDLNWGEVDADEVVIQSDRIFNMSVDDFISSTPCLLQPSQASKSDVNGATFRSNGKLTEESETDEDTSEDYMIIVEGLLRARDVSDESNSTSLLDAMTNSFKLNDSIIDSHVEFTDVEANDIWSEFINNVSVTSWILKESDQIQRITGRKRFTDNVHVEEEVVLGSWVFDTVTCHELNANVTNFGSQTFNKVDRLFVTESVQAEFLQAHNLDLKGSVDNVSWQNLVQDSVFESGRIVRGDKTLTGVVTLKNLILRGKINDLRLEDLAELSTKRRKTIVLDRDVDLNDPLTIDELNFEGTIDSTLRPNFSEEWMLQKVDQIIDTPLTFKNICLKSGSSLSNETINNISLRKLFHRSIKINEDATIKHLYALDKVKAEKIDVGGTVNGADFSDSVVRSRSAGSQRMLGEWFFDKGFKVNGNLKIEGLVSGLNLTLMCTRRVRDNTSLVVGGSLKLTKEPKITRVNNVDISEKTKELWMKNEYTAIEGSNVRFENIDFENRTTLFGYLNNINITHLSRQYLSKSSSRIISSDFEFDQLVIKNWCRMRKANVSGTVNGVDLSDWIDSVMLQDEDQIVEGRLRFNIFETSNLKLNGTINDVDMAKDVLRYDEEDSVVEGEKTFEDVRILNLTLAKGKKVQGVDIDSWREGLVTGRGNVTFTGDLIFSQAEFYGPVKVAGTVSGMKFDAEHVLLRDGNQVVTGPKHFNLTGSSPIWIQNLQVSGLVDGLDLSTLMKEQAYNDQDLIFTEAQVFTNALSAGAMEVDGTVQGVNMTELCRDVNNPIDVNELKGSFGGLMERTKTLIDVAKGRAYFFDYFELIQTLKPNVKAVVPTFEGGRHSLAVITPNMLRIMNWNEYSETFTNADDSLNLSDNITFVTSAVSSGSFLLYLESRTSAKIFTPGALQEFEAHDTSCVTSFYLPALNKSCIFIGQKRNSSRILCSSLVTGDLRTYQWLESRGSVQVVHEKSARMVRTEHSQDNKVTALNIKDEVYLAVINKEEIVDKFENSLTIYRFDPKLQHFHESHTLAEVNPVAVSAVSYKGNYYLVSAGGHLPESVDTPVDVHFALLPSSELALYVLTSNPTKPLVVYLHRGAAGFVEETSGLSLYPGSNLHSFTDARSRHFVLISGFGRGQILRAGFKGDRTPGEMN